VTLPLYLAGAVQREIAPQIQVVSTMVLMISAELHLITACPEKQSLGQQSSRRNQP
jgi:ABC-type spermidine/putrescine transport system permease subunit II